MTEERKQELRKIFEKLEPNELIYLEKIKESFPKDCGIASSDYALTKEDIEELLRIKSEILKKDNCHS